jgi:hypothetical protein
MWLADRSRFSSLGGDKVISNANFGWTGPALGGIPRPLARTYSGGGFIRPVGPIFFPVFAIRRAFPRFQGGMLRFLLRPRAPIVFLTVMIMAT